MRQPSFEDVRPCSVRSGMAGARRWGRERSRRFLAAGVPRAVRRIAQCCALFALGSTAMAQPLPGLDAVLGELRRGGLVLYFRHTATELSSLAETGTDLTRCETQRRLSVRGREDATRIGSAVRALGIPVGVVMASPFCRARDTAQLAFGRFVVNPDLYFAIGTGAVETARLAEALRRLLATPPAPGSNTVLVSHSANLREAAGLFPKPEGVAVVFRPLAEGRFEAVAWIPPEDWAGVAGLRPQ